MLGTTRVVAQGWREGIAGWAILQLRPINDCRQYWPGCFLDPEVCHPVMLVAVVLDEWPHDAIDQQKFVVAAVAVIETESIDYYAEPVLVAKVLIMGAVSDGVPVGLSETGEVVAVMVEAGVETGSVV